jgi:hypothetical protein
MKDSRGSTSNRGVPQGPPPSGRRGEYLTTWQRPFASIAMPAVTNNRNQWLKSQVTDGYDQPPTQTHAIQVRGPDTESGPLRQVPPSLRWQSQTTPHSDQQRANRDQSALTVSVAECQVVDLCRWWVTDATTSPCCPPAAVQDSDAAPNSAPARNEELIAAYRRGATPAALAVQFQIQRTTSPRYSSGK